MIGICLCCVAARADVAHQESDEALPSAATILDRYIDVTKGKAAYHELRNILSKGTFAVSGVPAQGNYHGL